MLKSLLLSFLFIPALFSTNSVKEKVDYNGYFEVTLKDNGNYKIVGVKDSYKDLEELRIYSSEFSNLSIDEIDGNAFACCNNLQVLMISYQIDTITNLCPSETFKTINYTGNASEFLSKSFSLDDGFVINYETNDEGFIYKWNKEVRPNENSNLCDITKTDYQALKTLYENLSIEDKQVVDSYIDQAGASIKDSMVELKKLFQGGKDVSEVTKEPSQNVMITLILTIAAFGMTFIGAFYILKDKNIIN